MHAFCVFCIVDIHMCNNAGSLSYYYFVYKFCLVCVCVWGGESLNAIYDDSKRARRGDVNSTSHRRNNYAKA